MGLFNLRDKNDLALTNNDWFTVDFHSHLIPGIDDGAGSTDESLEIITSLRSIGIKKIITTPHISMKYPNTREKILSSFEILKAAVIKQNIDIEMEVAAEYMIDEGFQNLLKSGKLMTFGNNYVLIELATFSPYPALPDFLFEMQCNGYNIVLAHPERYLYWQNNFEPLRKLKDRELYFQMNILSLTKIYSADIYKMALHLVKEKMIDFIGTDIHNIESIPLIKNTLTTKMFLDMGRTGQIKNNSVLKLKQNFSNFRSLGNLADQPLQNSSRA